MIFACWDYRSIHRLRREKYLCNLWTGLILVDDLPVSDSVILSVRNIDRPDSSAGCMFEPACAPGPLVDQIGMAHVGVESAGDSRGEQLTRSSGQRSLAFEIKHTGRSCRC